MARFAVFFFILLFASKASAQANGEVIYHVFQRSFFDSNGDGHGDLKGIRQKLDYLQGLGVNTILLTPLYHSDFYHNYFAHDFSAIDPEYGNADDYEYLVLEIHRRGMKIYQDVEMQYVAGTHPWFRYTYGKPKENYFKGTIFYEDALNQKPWYFMGVPEFTTFDNTKQQIIVVNMKDIGVRDYTRQILEQWIDFNFDGEIDDSVDGFRLDHMMDDLDNEGKLTNLFANFWTPLLADIKKVNPDLQIVAEQANWNSYGHEYFTKGNVDRVFAFRLKQAIATFDKQTIEMAADSTFNYLPEGKQQVVFIENHDTNRFASEKDMNPGKLKVGAALNILIGGIPSLYYGQELGMKGVRLSGKTDGNDIPIREAFEWYKAEEGPGMATWYKDTGEWWDKRNMRPNDGISLEEQQADPKSLYNYYRELIAIKKKYPEFASGAYSSTPNDNDKVLTFLRTSGKNMALVVINLSGEQQFAVLLDNKLRVNSTRILSGNSELVFDRGSRALALPPYAVQVYRFFPAGPR